MNSAGRKHRKTRGTSQQQPPPPQKKRLRGRDVFRRIFAKIRSTTASAKKHLWRRWLLARYSFYRLVLTSSKPSEVRVEERYYYKFKLTGVQYRHLQAPEGQTEATGGEIKVTVPYDGRQDIEPSSELKARLKRKPIHKTRQSLRQRLQQWLKQKIEPGTREDLKQKPVPIWGKLEIKDFGDTQLSEQSVPELEERHLPLDTNFQGQELVEIRINPKGKFNIQLSQAYLPDEPEHVPVEIQVRVSDEEEAKTREELKKEAERKNDAREELEKEAGNKNGSQITPQKLLIQDVTAQTHFKRTLEFRFQVFVTPSLRRGHSEEDNPTWVKISRMTMDWPISTAPSSARLRLGNSERRVSFNPVPPDKRDNHGTLEWFDIPLELQGGVYQSEEIWLEVDEPGEAQNQLTLEGKVKIELDSLLSGLQMQYKAYEESDEESLSIVKQSTVEISYELRVDECFADKRYSPQQHLQFPGIILDEFRLADVLMLLKDKRFEVEQPYESQRQELLDDVGYQHIIEATRDEGTGKLTLWLLLQGTPSETIRERETNGKALYRTQLPTGQTIIYMHGGLEGDRKRAVQILNELHHKLKEHFQYVGTVD